MAEPSDTPAFFRPRLAEMIDLRLPWAHIEAALAPYSGHRARAGRQLEQGDIFGPSLQLVGAGVAAGGCSSIQSLTCPQPT